LEAVCPPKEPSNVSAGRASGIPRHQATEGDEMYIGGGFLALILIILLLIWLF
jgi:hypothetical protein